MRVAGSATDELCVDSQRSSTTCTCFIRRRGNFMVLYIFLLCLSLTSHAGSVAFLLPRERRCAFHSGCTPRPSVRAHVSLRSLAPHTTLYSAHGGDASQTDDTVSVSGGVADCEGMGDQEGFRKQLGTSQLLHVRLLASRMQQMIKFYCGLLGMSVLSRFKPSSSDSSHKTSEPYVPDGRLENKAGLWGPLDGAVALGDGTTLPVDEVVLLGFPHNAPSGSCPCSSGDSHQCLNTLKIELVYNAAWAERQIAKEEAEKEALRKEECALVSAIAAFERRHSGRESKGELSGSTSTEDGLSDNAELDKNGTNLQLDSDGLPSLPRVRAFERKRGKFDRNHHGFFGFTVLLPSLKNLQLDKVIECGAKMVHCPARRKQLPSMFPDQHAKQELWDRSCFLLDPDGNGVEVLELSNSSSATAGVKALKNEKTEVAVNLWHSMLADHEVDVDRQKRKQELQQQLFKVQSERARLTALHEESVQKEALFNEEGSIPDGDVQTAALHLEALKKEEADILQKLETFETQQKVLDELEHRQQALEQQRQVETAGVSVTHEGPLTPRLQKVRLYTTRLLDADRFFGKSLKMHGRQNDAEFVCAQLLRFKSHLLERIYPWSRFGAMSRSYACEALALEEKRKAAKGAEAASRVVSAAAEAAGSDGLYGSMDVPVEWQGFSAENPGAAAALVFKTEAAERNLPQLQVAYAYDEDKVSVHPAFLHLAVGVDNVPQTLQNVRAVEHEAVEKSKEYNAKNLSSKDPEHFKEAQTGAKGITEFNPSLRVPPKPTEVVLQTNNSALVRNFDGYPILFVKKSEALGYYEALRARTHASP